MLAAIVVKKLKLWNIYFTAVNIIPLKSGTWQASHSLLPSPTTLENIFQRWFSPPLKLFSTNLIHPYYFISQMPLHERYLFSYYKRSNVTLSIDELNYRNLVGVKSFTQGFKLI
jgi:hypothetical protein